MKSLFPSFLRRIMLCPLLILAFCLSATTARADTATAVYDKNTKTLIFFMLSDLDLKKYTESSDYQDCVWTGNAVLNQGLYSISWSKYKKEIETVMFNSSFADARPRYTSYWFAGCSALKTVKGISNVNTIETIDMRSMFADCSSLTKVDLSTFNAGNVEYMINLFSGCSSLTSVEIPYNTIAVKSISGMFQGCSSLTTIDLSTLKTTSLTNMSSLFYNCSKLEKVDLSLMRTSNVTDMSSLFRGCGSLKQLDLSKLNTSSVTDMSYMFFQCAMPSIDVSNFDVSKVVRMDEMFSQNSKLRKIYCDKDWKQISSSTSIMFFNCPNLSGSIVFDSKKYNINYANPTTGYFTPSTFSKNDYFAIWCSDNATLYFTSFTNAYRIGDKFEDGMITDFWWCDEMLDNSAIGYPVWNLPTSSVVRNNVKTVVFTENFRTARPKCMKRWFYDFQLLKSVKGLDNLNAADVTDMDSLFANCRGLSEMEGLNAVNTDSVTNMNHMFFECRSLPEIDVSKFNTANVTDMSCMFNYCQSVKALDVGSFNTSKVNDFSKMFAYCTSLETIFCENTWDASTPSKDMFYRCEKLVGKIPYDSWMVDANYANPNTGYFTGVDKYNLWICGTQVTSKNCKDLTVIEDVSSMYDDGVFSYDPTTNTLLMKNMSIISENEVALYNGIKNLLIQSEGDGSIVRSDHGKAAFMIDAPTCLSGSTLFVLGGTLIEQTTIGMYLGNTLSIEDANVLAGGTKGIAGDIIEDANVLAGGTKGIAGDITYDSYGTATYPGSLSVTGKSVVYAYGTDAAISDLSALTLGKHVLIVDPADAVFDSHAVRLNGDVVTGAVTIMYLLPGDVNLDGEVNISDVVAIINTMAGDTTFEATANVNGDDAVNISDIVAVINIMAGQ